MLRIQYLDKDRFMQQVAASRGSVLLHLDNGETCDLKKDNAATELFQMMDAPSKALTSLSPTLLMSPASCTTCSRPAAEIASPADPSTFSFFRILQQCKTPAPGSEAGARFTFVLLQDAPADGPCHRQQLILPDEAELRLVLIRKADRQL